ncbi:hypothetical protein [Solihabitans fulvus]|nr:hypothetical protein [Solihabitans fulvus]
MSEWDGPGDSPGFLLWKVALAWQCAMRAALAPHSPGFLGGLARLADL